jgi:hypothetical protein
LQGVLPIEGRGEDGEGDGWAGRHGGRGPGINTRWRA